MTHKKKSLILFFIILCTLSALSFGVNVEGKQRDLDKINQELARQKKLLQETKKKEKRTLRDIYVINKKVRGLKRQIYYTQNKLYKTINEIGSTREALSKTTAKHQAKQKEFNQRLREIYKTQNLGYFYLFFSTKSFSQLIDDSYYYAKIIEQDLGNINDLNALKQDLSRKTYSLGYQKRQIETLKTSMQKQKTNFASKKQQKQTLYSSLKAQRRTYERKIEELLKNSQEMENLIQRLQQGTPTAAKGTGRFIWPIRGMITSYYGYRRHPIFKVTKLHTGIDVAAKMGTKIKATDGGTVIHSGWWGGYGKATIIDHGNGYSSVYAHQKRIYVKKGARVKQGQIIGLVGSTGYSTGPHIHFEIRVKGKTVNPLKYLRK